MDNEEADSITKESQTFNVSEILRNVLIESKTENDRGIRPSEYLQQMLLTTEERLDYSLKTKKRKNFKTLLKSENQNFEVIPPVVIFQQFTVGDVYNVTVAIRNNSQVSRYLKTSCEVDPFFSVEFRGSCYSTVVAPGLSHLYNVKFVPEERRDYEYQLKFVTDVGDFVVPVIAIGPRGILDFPDRLELPATAVKIPSSKTIFVRNVGNTTAIFTIYSDNPCFSIKPSAGRIDEEETLQFTANFLSANCGDFEGKLFLEYETGEKLEIVVRCEATNCTIRIDRGSIKMEKTYLGLTRSKILTIYNRSDYIVKFQWMRFKDSETDNQKRQKYKRLFHLVYEMEFTRCVNLVHYNICKPDVHQQACQRIYADEIVNLMNEKFRYNHLCFILTPEEGEIWPQSSTEVVVLYRAFDVGEETSTAYLEITGREERIPLSLCGTGKGPVFRLNVVTIDLENIYLCSVHNYELSRKLSRVSYTSSVLQSEEVDIIAANKGHINGTLVHRSKPTDFGGTINVTPPSLTLKPDEHKSFNLSFSSNRKGDFVERVDFVIKESLEVLSLHIKGCIVCPTLHFDKESLDFGTTALGFSTRQEVCLHNLSSMPVTFSITVLNDGDQPPLICEEFAKAETKPSFPSNPQEFRVSPDGGVVSAHSCLKIRIIYTANIVRSGQTTVQVDMWDSDSDPVTLPITFCGKVATLTINPVEISIRFCFINFPYSRSFNVENTSDLDGYFYLLPQPIFEDSSIVCSLSMYQGYIRARQSKVINVSIITRIMGKQDIRLSMLTMGGKSLASVCVITCNGQGPVVSAQPTSLDFGEVQVLEKRAMKLTVISDSPIPAHFKVSLNKKNSPWSVNPNSGDLEPNGSMEIEITVYLRDSGKYSDNITLLIVNSRSISVYLSAIGIGCSILFEPDIFPIFDMGLLFSHQKISVPIKMKNLGTRQHQILWSNVPEVRMKRGQIAALGLSKFYIQPMISEVPVGETAIVNCKLRWDSNETVQEDWYVFGQIHGQAKRELIGTSTFKVTLTEPRILFSKKELMFRIDKCSDGDIAKQIDEVSVTNQSQLDLNIALSIESPFDLITEQEEHVKNMKIIVADGATSNIRVHFSPTINNDNLYSQTYNGVLWLEYDEHPSKDKIKCKGFVNFPNITISPKDLIINCELGSSAEEILTLVNNGPVSVTYKFVWIGNSIQIKHGAHSNYEPMLQSPCGRNLEIHNICVQSATNQDTCVYRQDGSGDGPSRTIPPPVNSPASERYTQKMKSEYPEENPGTTDSKILRKKVRELLVPIITKYFVKDKELLALEALKSEPRPLDLVNEVLNIVPCEGTVLPYTIQHVHIAFHGFETLEVKVKAECRILRGPTEEINIVARADAIQYSLNKEVLNFGQQLCGKSSKQCFVLENHSTVTFTYKVDNSVPAFNGSIDRSDVYPLKIEPNEGFVDGQSSVKLDVVHRPMVLGPIDHQFKLEIGHLMPVTMKITAIGTYPQVYLNLPQKDLKIEHSIELGYSAIQSLTTEYIINKSEITSSNVRISNKKPDLSEENIAKHIAEEWCIISNTETVPTIMDVKMAVERHLASKFIDENSYALLQYITTQKKEPILSLYSQEYVIDMGHVIIGLVTHYTATLINYGPWNVEMRMRKQGRKDVLGDAGIVVQFKKQTNLAVGDCTALHVTWHPSSERYTERSTQVKQTIFLEVIHGCTIPVNIQGTVTYPYLTLNTRLLDYQDVLVGECLTMFILVKNEGLVDCYWNAKLAGTRRKKEDGPFYVQYESNHCPPGDAEVIRITFKPRKTCYVEAKLNVIVDMSLETQTVMLTGRGIERRLKIIEPVVSFLPIVPFTEVQEAVFTVENVCEYPVEFFWHHLDNSFKIEERVAKALTHYYEVEEILLPPKKLGDPLSPLLIEFYDSLIKDMAYALSAEKIEEETTLLGNEDRRITKGSEEQNEYKHKKAQNRSRKKKKRLARSSKSIGRKSSVRESTYSKKNYNSSSDSSGSDLTINKYAGMSVLDENFDDPPELPTNDPEEIQQLLHCFINKLHKNTDFYKKMRDPVREVFKNIDTKSASLNCTADPAKPKKKVCIIFHGAPFTEYQETACRSAKTLGLSVLHIDKAITEILAFGESPCSKQLREIIDDVYKQHMMAFEQQKEVLAVQPSQTNEGTDLKAPERELNEAEVRANEIKSPKNEKSPGNKSARARRGKNKKSKSTDEENQDVQQEVTLRLHADPDPLTEFNKIADIENTEELDSLSRYENKIEAILLLQKILSPQTVVGLAGDKGSFKGGDKSVRKKNEETFLGIDVELLAEALQERLSMKDFKHGYVVQSLKSIFFCDNTLEILLLLLRITGHVEYSLFVTFQNSMDNYYRKVSELRELYANGALEYTKRIQDIDEMSLSEYDLLAEEDKKMYLDAILPAKREDALHRRTEFAEHMANLRKKKTTRDRISGSTGNRNRRAVKSARSKATEITSQEKKSTNSRPISSKKGTASRKTRSRDSSRRRKEKVPLEVQKVINAMDEYYTELSEIENLIQTWDPVKKVDETQSAGKVKIPRSAKPKDKGPLDTTRETPVNKFHVWYVKAHDPWCDEMYNTIVTQMSENCLAKNAIATEVRREPDLRPQVYSIFKSKNIQERQLKTNDNVYELVSISPVLEYPLVINESIHVNEINTQENTKRHSKQRQNAAGKTEDHKSLNETTIESRDVYHVPSFETIVEKPVKPRSILQPNEKQKFKIFFRPKATGIYDETYALDIANGGNITYDIHVKGIADIPKINMNPETIFPQVENTKPKDEKGMQFLDTGIFDFGSILVLRKDKRVHRPTVEFQFHNISEVDAEVSFFLTENNPGSFSIEPDKMLIGSGNSGSLNLSAVATKLGSLSDQLYICIKNNPKVESIELRSSGARLNIELDEKQLSFERTLLHRRESVTLTVRNKSAVAVFWSIEVDEPAEPQITFTPNRGAIKSWDEQKIQFCYHATRIGIVEEKTMSFKVYLYEEDEDPIFAENIMLSGETYDVAVDINHANPIDLKCVKVDFPASAFFVIRNRGHYEVKYVILLEDKEKLRKAMPNYCEHFKECLEIHPTCGSVNSNREAVVQVIFIPKSEITIKNAAILKCHLLDTHKETTVIAEIPLTVSLTSYYTRFRVYPYPLIDFGSVAICTEKTVYLNIENTGKFPLHYTIFVQNNRHPSVAYMSSTGKEAMAKKLGGTSKRDKKSTKSDSEPEVLIVGPMTITKTEGDIDVGQIETIAINCYPEIVGHQEEEITVLVPDSVPENRNGISVRLSVNSSIPGVDLRDLDAMFQENHVVDYIQDSDFPKEMGTHTVFTRQEKCLYFRYVSVLTTYTTCFKLHNRNIIPADVRVVFSQESLKPKTAKPDTFVVEPSTERIPPMSYKTFTVSFTPSIIETFHGVFEITVDLPAHLNDENLLIKLVGEACVPEVAIVDPVRGKREKPVLNFGRTLVNEKNTKVFALENIGYIPAKVIVEVYEDNDFLFTFAPCSDSRHLLHVWEDDCNESNDRWTVVRLMPGNVARFEATFHPKEIGRREGQIRFFIVDNPYENLTINLGGEAYEELVVLDGLELMENRRRTVTGSRDSGYKARKISSKQNSVVSASTSLGYTISLCYHLEYGNCFINKMYKKTFKIANKSKTQWFRFQWSAHPNVVFVPSIGHLKYLTSKEITATFLASETANYVNTHIDCTICEMEIADSTNEMVWDDRQTEVRWEEMDYNITNHETDAETLARKVVEPTAEPSHEVVPGTVKTIQVLLNATVGFSEYSCDVQEIYFKDTLMFQTREYTFTVSNPGVVSTVYVWKINMDEQYPKRQLERSPNVTSRSISGDNRMLSGPQTGSLKGIFSSSNKLSRGTFQQEEIGEGDTGILKSHQFAPPPSYEGNKLPPALSSRRASDLFSSSAGLTERSTDSWLEGDDLPFAIYPEEGTLLPGQSTECTLKFSPKDVFCYKAYLTFRMENRNPKVHELVIPVAARSLLPYCHFDVQESDYVSSGRRDPKLPGPMGYEIENDSLWENIRVIEFKVVGVGETHVKKFHLINPMADDYHFSWRNRTYHSKDEISNFHCAVSEGIAERGKRTDLAFTFLAENVGIFESFWLFSIERYNLESLFLFVGTVTEPSVYCLTIHLKLKPTILGIKVRDAIKIFNNEDFDIPFRILEESLHSEGKLENLTVTPMTGILAPKSEQIMCVEYHPTRVGEFHFSVQCAVKMMKKPLTVFVTTSVYDIVSTVSYSTTKNCTMEAHEDKENIIDFGKVMLREACVVTIDVKNSGKIAFYYAWDLGMTPELVSRNLYSVTTTQKQGHVTSECQSTCYLTFTAFHKVMIKDHCVTLKITRGPTYRFILKASAKKPSVEFSFHQYDFGPCYIQQNNAFAYYVELQITNCEDTPFIIECQFEEQPHISVDIEAISQALAPHSTIDIPITFRPLKEIKYQECLVFIINSTTEKRVTIIGEGITYKIRLVNARDKLIDLGSIPARKRITRKIPIINEGRAPVELKFGLIKSLTGDRDHQDRMQTCEPWSTVEEAGNDQSRASILETRRSWTSDADLQTAEPSLIDVLQIEPSKNVVLRPDKRINVILNFKPTRRMKPFSSKVALQTASMILPLFVVRGSCVGAQFRLNRTYLSFGTVVQGFVNETVVVLFNTGDVGARFKWNTSNFPADFSITPISGYCPPGMDVNFVVKFQPTQQQSVIEGQAIIQIEKYDSLSVKITGGCCKLPEPMETLFFTSNVRDKQTKFVTILNDTNLSWKLKPEVTGDYFSAQEILNISPQTSGSCPVIYAPTVMNNENDLHKGTLLLKLPNGDIPMLYSLRGLSMPPVVLAKIHRQFPAKTKYTELLPVYNWLDRQQRFDCKIELLNNGKVQSNDTPLFNFISNGRIDVPPNSHRDYRTVFYSYGKSKFNFKVVFITEDNEYQFYEIAYEVTEPEVIESIKLTTTVRSAVCHVLKLENPLEDQSVIYKAQWEHTSITLNGMPDNVAPLSHEFVNISYYPLLPSDESIVRLNIHCQELGNFPYELRLKAMPALPERVTRVNAILGNNAVFSLIVRNNAKQKVQFKIKTDNESLTCQRTIEVDTLNDGTIDVIYEPSDIENITATVIASSDVAGEFIFPVIGTYSVPKPLGPYTVMQRMTTLIPFKNVFKESKTFELILDIPEVFAVEAQYLSIRSKQNVVIKVTLRSQNQKEDEFNEDKYPVTGKLVVYCTDQRLSHINWIYYLRGVFE